MYLYLDESGDLGFNFKGKRCSKKFVITILACFNETSRREFRKAVQRTIKNKVNKNKKKQKVQELKGSRSNINIKKYFLRNVKTEDWQVYSIILNKNRVYNDLRTPRGQKKLYNFLSRVLMENLVPLLQDAQQPVELIVDKSKSKEEIKDFNQYLENQLESILPLNVPLHIYHLNSLETYELQAVDLFCWGIFRKFEHQDLEWYKCFSHHVNCEMEYLK
jgi:hypothetical protein